MQLSGAHQGDHGPEQQRFDIAAWRGNSDVRSASGFLCCGGVGKEGITPIRPGCREDRATAAAKQSTHLLLGSAHRCGGRHDLGPDGLAIDLSAAELIDHCFIEAGHRSQWSGDQMQLVLNDQIGCIQASLKRHADAVGRSIAGAVVSLIGDVAHLPEQLASAAKPGQ